MVFSPLSAIPAWSLPNVGQILARFKAQRAALHHIHANSSFPEAQEFQVRLPISSGVAGSILSLRRLLLGVFKILFLKKGNPGGYQTEGQRCFFLGMAKRRLSA